ncbi:winged helix-turn-helix domain-containing protein [Tahibacter harae]|uniref:Winged helix-turn-helix domain-containing protein n=1 Tax=Tahibacter harae TaxID=2963937 RepID=A0ABT1QUE2_9GAMM|nr:winged helix-turn-helix domain-containing protein [Tahibacter harae]MCQ4165888.1 winged helix-turn-helix domain-containing protein [Tahibacter harae]
MSDGVYCLDDLVVDTRRRRVRRGAAELEVSGLSFDLLAFLLRQGDRVVSFDELLAAVWAPTVVGEETVTQRVKLLRQALGDDGRRSRYLRSVRGRGYQLCSVPRRVEAEDEARAIAAEKNSGVEVVTGAAGRAAVELESHAGETTAARAIAAEAAGSPATAPAIAPAHAGIARPAPANTAASADTAASANAIAPAVMRTAAPAATHQPVAASNGLRWVLLLTALPLAVLGVLAWQRTHQPPPAPTDTRIELLQRARYYAGIGQKDDVERAITLYETLLQRDARDSAAQTGLSFAYSARVCLYNQEPYWAERAEDLARAALEREPGDSRAVAALAYSLDCRGKLAQAIAEYERAVALDPAGSDSAASLAYLYMVKGSLAEALRRNLALREAAPRPRYLDIQIARNLELLGATAAAERGYARSFQLYPDNVFSNAAWPRCLFLQGRLGEAETALAQARQRSEHPELYLLQGELALLRGQREQAAAAFAAAAKLRPHASLPQTLARLYAEPTADAGWLAQRSAALEASISRDDWPEDQLELTLLRLARGDRAGALAALQEAVEAGWRDRAYLQTSALFQPLAAEPGFAGVLEAIAERVQRERVAAAADIAAAERGIP